MKDNIQLLNAMIADMRAQKGVHQVSGYWTRHTKKIRNAILHHGLKDFRRHPDISRNYGDPPYIYDFIDLLPAHSLSAVLLKLLRRIPPVKYLYKSFRKINKGHIAELQRYKTLYVNSQVDAIGKELLPGQQWPETLAGNPSCKVAIEGVEIGQANLRSLVEIRNCGQVIDFKAVNVAMEIGGGLGAYTHMLLHCFPNIRKVIYLDIPPVLYVSTQYLRHYFGDAVIDYSQSRHLEKIEFKDNDELEIYCIAPWQLPLVEASINYFWNSASFQEMPKEVVANYARELSRLQDPEHCNIALYIYERNDSNTLSYDTILDLLESHGIHLNYHKPENSSFIIQEGRHYISSVS